MTIVYSAAMVVLVQIELTKVNQITPQMVLPDTLTFKNGLAITAIIQAEPLALKVIPSPPVLQVMIAHTTGQVILIAHYAPSQQRAQVLTLTQLHMKKLLHIIIIML